VGIESPVHLLFIAVVALVVLGPKRLPSLAKALGQGIREFRQALDLGQSGEQAPPPPPPAASTVSAPSASSATPAPEPPPAPSDTTAAGTETTVSAPAPGDQPGHG
jgi:TatA/E family protein of Tat protein translocase